MAAKAELHCFLEILFPNPKLKHIKWEISLMEFCKDKIMENLKTQIQKVADEGGQTYEEAEVATITYLQKAAGLKAYPDVAGKVSEQLKLKKDNQGEEEAVSGAAADDLLRLHEIAERIVSSYIQVFKRAHPNFSTEETLWRLVLSDMDLKEACLQECGCWKNNQSGGKCKSAHVCAAEFGCQNGLVIAKSSQLSKKNLANTSQMASSSKPQPPMAAAPVVEPPKSGSSKKAKRRAKHANKKKAQTTTGTGEADSTPKPVDVGGACPKSVDGSVNNPLDELNVPEKKSDLPTTIAPQPETNQASSQQEVPAKEIPTEENDTNPNPIPVSKSTDMSPEEKDLLLKLLQRKARQLEDEIPYWTNWANQRVSEAAVLLKKNKNELQKLRRERDTPENRAELKRVVDEQTEKRICEITEALQKTNAEAKRIEETEERLKKEKAVLKQQMLAAKREAEEAAARRELALGSEQNTLRKVEDAENERKLMEEELRQLKKTHERTMMACFMKGKERDDILQTYEAQYCFKSLEMAREWFGDLFYQSYYSWDSFTAGIAVSDMRNSNDSGTGENEFAELEYMNITVITSNGPYGISNGSNPFFDNRQVPKFNLTRNGVHSGHVQTGLEDPFCRGQNGKGICKDGYSMETTGPESVRVRVATKAKPNSDANSTVDREFFKSFLEVLNSPQNSGRFNFTTQFAHYTAVLNKPDFGNRTLGRPFIFDMDMSAGDFLALFYLLKVPVEVLNLKAILVSPTGWANAATIDVVYDLLHMMGRDDILVGLGDAYAMNQTDPIFAGVGNCKYSKSIPNGAGGFLDSDTLYGLARNLPRGPRRYTAENSLEISQLSALQVWDMVMETLDVGSNITILANGPLTSLASILLSRKNTSSSIQEVLVVGGHISNNTSDKGNVFTIPSNEYAEFNMFLDPFAAKTVFESGLNIKLIPLSIQRRFSTFPDLLDKLRVIKKTPEVLFCQNLLSQLLQLQQTQSTYNHLDTFVGEILGAVILSSEVSDLSLSFTTMPIKVSATGEESEDGQLFVDEEQGKSATVLDGVDVMAYYNLLTDRLGDMQQTAVIASFADQIRRQTPHS